MVRTYHRVELSGVASAAPHHFFDEKDLTKMVGEKVAKKQISATGIKSRSYCIDGQNAVDLACQAAEKMMASLEWKREDIKFLFYVSSYTMFTTPSTAFLIHDRLGLNRECFVSDMNAACTAFIVGVQSAGAFLESAPLGTKALVLTAGTPNADIDQHGRTTAALFGDAASAIGLETVEQGCINCDMYSDGSRRSIMMREKKDKPFMMDGMEVFQFAISEVVDSINQFFIDCNINKNEIDYFVIHQAQKYILDKIIDFCELPPEKVLISYDKYGNTGGSSIAVTMSHNAERFDDSKKQKIFFCGYGSGLSWGNIMINATNMKVLPVLLTDKRD